MVKKTLLKRVGKQFLLLFLILCLSLETGCMGKSGTGTTDTKSSQEGSDQRSKPKTQVQEAFSQYLDQLFQSEVTGSTLNMHYTLAHPENYGITSYPVTYGNISVMSAQTTSAILENWKSKLETFRKKKLTVAQQMTYDIIMDFIQEEMPSGKFALHQELLKPTTGIQAQLPVLMSEYTFYDEQDVKDYLQLLTSTPDYFAQIMAFEKQKSDAGLFMADFAAEDIINSCANFIQEPQNNYMLATFDDRIDALTAISPEQAEGYKVQNRQIVTEQVIPAYEKMIQELAALKETGKNSQGLSYLEDGKEYYEYLVSGATGSHMSVEEMMAQTDAQRQADLAGLAQLINEDPGITQKCVSYNIATDDPTLILQDLQVKMQQDFPVAPDTTFTIKQVHPSLEEYTAPAFYLTPPIDDISQNSIYINTSKNYEKIQLYTTLAHEGFPGHLYQNIMERSCGLDPVRSLFGSSGYAEGWATYVEMQSFYYADIDNEVAAFLQKNQSALLSLYASADMGIHYQGWSLADTVDFFAKYKVSDKAVINEIYQLIVEEPAHYLKYYIGYLEFLNLRQYAKEQYKEEYSNYKFHSALMKMGAAPFTILKEYLPKYWE